MAEGTHNLGDYEASDDSNGDYILKDPQGNIVQKWDDTNNQWDYNQQEITNLSSVKTDQLQTKARKADILVSQGSGGTYYADDDSSELASGVDLGTVLQTVIDNMATADELVYLALSGTHTVTGAPVDLNRDNLTFEGPGWNLTLKMPDGLNDSVFENTAGNTRSNVNFRDFALDENRTNQDGTQNDVVGITVNPAVDCNFEHLHCFDGQNEAIRTASTSSENVTIRNCRFENHNQDSDTSAHITIGNDTLVEGCYFRDCDDNAIFQANGSENQRIANNHFVDCQSGIVSPPTGVNGVTITGNIVEGDTLGIARFNDTGGSYDDWTISDNIVRNITLTETFAIDSQNGDDGLTTAFTITGNVIRCNGNISGVRLNYARDCTVNDNTVLTARNDAINVAGGEEITVSDNTIKNPDADNNGRAGVLITSDGTNDSINVTVTGNTIVDDRSTNQMSYGINAGQCQWLIVGDNQIKGATDSERRNITIRTNAVVNGLGYNSGDPASTGQWNGEGYEGLTVRDTSNNNTYLYNDGVWSQIASA